MYGVSRDQQGARAHDRKYVNESWRQWKTSKHSMTEGLRRANFVYNNNDNNDNDNDNTNPNSTNAAVFPDVGQKWQHPIDSNRFTI